VYGRPKTIDGITTLDYSNMDDKFCINLLLQSADFELFLRRTVIGE
jgi:hypothetical protein